ncbi:MAG: type II toxin-antitoxin system RelE/ParE family toxin [bacterium]|nr:type II toxin-antitoxin system RelE/ParE family toxin [bacterium]
MEWEIILFESQRGEKFVEEFIFAQQEHTRAKIAHEIDLLERHGPFLNMPHARRLKDKLYELRIRGKEEIRIMYAFLGSRAYLLHAFRKQKQKTPAKEIETAQKRLGTLLTR